MGVCILNPQPMKMAEQPVKWQYNLRTNLLQEKNSLIKFQMTALSSTYHDGFLLIEGKEIEF